MKTSGPLTLTASLDRPRIARGQPTRVHLVTELVATADRPAKLRPPLALVLALDSSGSMAGEKLRHVVRSVEFLVEQLQPEDQLGLVCFANTARVLLPLTRADRRIAPLAQAALGQLRAVGGTNVEAGLRFSHRVLASGHQDAQSSVLLLSDGVPNSGAVTPLTLGALARELRGAVSISTLGYGEDHDDSVLGELAESGGGTYSYVAAPELCRVELARAVGTRFELAADQVTEAFGPGRGVRVERVLGAAAPARVGADGLEAPVADLGLAERRLLTFVLTVEPYAELGPATLGHLRVRFRPAGGAASAVESLVTAEVVETAGALDPDANARRLLCSAVEARAEATRLAGQQQFEQAEAGLLEVIEEIRRAPVSAASARLDEVREQLLDDAELMGQRPGPEAQRAFRRGQRATPAQPQASPALLDAAFSQVPAARLVFLKGMPGRDVPLQREMVLGRTPDADLQLPGSGVSRRHTRIVAAEGGYWVNDLGSSNGTFLNGAPVDCQRLRDGDVVGVGEFRFVYRER